MHERGRCRGDEYLRAEADRHEARAPVQRPTEVMISAPFDFSRMDRHPDAELADRPPGLAPQCDLRVESRRDGVTWLSECGVHRVAHRFKDDAVVSVDRPAE